MWKNSDIIITTSNMTKFCSPYKCTLCIKAQENFMYVLGQGKVQKRLICVLSCSCIFMNIYAYLSLLYYVLYSSTVQYVYYFMIIHFS